MATSLNALVLKIGADTSGVSAGVKAVKSDVNRINRIMRQSATDTDKARQATQSLARIYKTGALSQKEYARGLAAIKDRYGTTGRAMDRFRGQLSRIGVATASMGRRLARATAVVAGFAAAMGGLAAIKLKKSFTDIDSLAKTSDKLGIATEKLGALRFAAEETGIGADTLDMALQRMVRRIAEAGQGTGEAKNAIAELGLNAQRLAAMSPDEQFKQIAEAMSGVGNQSDRLRLAFKLFDSEGAALVNTLKLGRQGLDEYETSANRLGVAVNRFDAAQIEKANDAFGRIGLVVEGLTNKIAIGLAPIVEGLSRSFVEWGSSTDTSAVQISANLQGIAKAVAFVGDGVGLWLRAFKSVRAYLAEFFSWAATQFLRLTEIIAGMLDAIPGIEAEPLEFSKAFAAEMEGAAKTARKEADKAWKEPFPSAGIEKFFADIDRNIKKAKEEFDSMTPPSPVGLPDVPNVPAASVPGTDASPLKVEFPPSAQRGSREEFALLRDMQNREAQRQSQLQQKQVALLGTIGTGIADLVRNATGDKDLFNELISAVKSLDLGESV